MIKLPTIDLSCLAGGIFWKCDYQLPGTCFYLKDAGEWWLPSSMHWLHLASSDRTIHTAYRHSTIAAVLRLMRLMTPSNTTPLTTVRSDQYLPNLSIQFCIAPDQWHLPVTRNTPYCGMDPVLSISQDMVLSRSNDFVGMRIYGGYVYGLCDGKWVRQHIPKKKNNMLLPPCTCFLEGVSSEGRCKCGF